MKLIISSLTVLSHMIIIGICSDEKEESSQKQDQLFKLEIPLGLTVPEKAPGSGELLWRQAVQGTSLATLLGGLGVLALATPAAYIAFQSGQSGENPLSLTKRYYKSMVTGSDVGNLDYTKDSKDGRTMVDRVLGFVRKGRQIYNT